MCFYVVGWYDYEWNEEYVLFNPACPSKEQFRNDVRNAVSLVVDRLLVSEGFICVEELTRGVVKELTRRGYSTIRYIDTVKFWGGILRLKECLEDRTNREIIGEENCRKIDKHNEEVDKEIMKSIKLDRVSESENNQA